MKKSPTLTILLAGATALLVSCGGEKESATESNTSEAAQPAGMDGAKALLTEILNDPDKAADLSKNLRPSSEDYTTVFDAEFAKKAEAVYTPAWDSGALVIKAKPHQTELKLWSASSKDLKAWNENARPFPGGYKRVASHYKDGITIYRFKFVKPGENLGMAYDGLIHVNGHWRIFPKPWRIER